MFHILHGRLAGGAAPPAASTPLSPQPTRQRVHTRIPVSNTSASPTGAPCPEGPPTAHPPPSPH
jgi:hypothetical protein